MSRKVILCLIGLPAAGKTTLCRSLLKRYSPPSSPFHLLHLPFDSHLPQVDHTVDVKGWQGARNQIKLRVKEYLEGSPNSVVSCPMCPRTSSGVSHVLLLDDNFYYRGMRKEYYHLAQHHRCAFGQVVFNTDTASAITRNEHRMNSTVTRETIEKMNKLFEFPVELWERHVLSLKSVPNLTDGVLADRSSQVAGFIEQLLQVPLEVNPADLEAAREAERTKNLNNALQKCDVCLRKIISRKIKADRELNIQRDYSDYVKIKTSLLGKVKSGCIDLPSDSDDLSLLLDQLFDDEWT